MKDIKDIKVMKLDKTTVYPYSYGYLSGTAESAASELALAIRYSKSLTKKELVAIMANVVNTLTSDKNMVKELIDGVKLNDSIAI